MDIRKIAVLSSAFADSALVLYIPFDEGSGNESRDLSGFNNHAVFNDGVEWGFSERGNVGVFNGISAYCNCGNAASLNIAETFTIEAWIQPTDVFGSPQSILSKANYELREYDDEYIFQVLGEIGSWTLSGGVGTRPRGLAVYDGKLYATCYDSNNVYVFDGSSWTLSGGVGTSPYGLAVYDGKLYATCYGSNNVYTIGTGKSIRAEKPFGLNYVVCVINTTTLKLYINGELKSQTSHSLNVDGNDKILYIGKGYGSSQSGLYGGNDENFNGSIESVLIYNRVLTASEIKDRYQDD